MIRRFPFVPLFLLALFGTGLEAQTVVQSRGVDSRVDYAELDRFGPWDDRNYSLTQDDLELLADNEAELNVHVPAFFRVQLRRDFPDMLRTGRVQYPRSSLPRFLVQYGGYLIEGQLYRSAVRTGEGRYRIDLEAEAIEEEEWLATRFLDGEARVTNPNAAAESAIAIHPTDTDLVIAGSNGPGSGQKMHYSSDGGATWSLAASLPLFGTCCDPTVAWSSDGTYAYTATLGSAVFFYRSSDNGQTWDDLANEPGADPRRELGGGVDKEYLHVDLSPTSPYFESIYLTWHEGNILKFARSADFGHTWSTPISFFTDPRGIGSDITTDNAGNIYYFYPAFNTQEIIMLKSTDGGANFGASTAIASTEGSFIFPVPSMETREVFIYNAADTDRTSGDYAGSIYVSWTDSLAATGGIPANNHARIQVAYSRDGGGTWTVVTPHETADADSVDRWHQWLSVASDGSVHVIFYDTRNDPTRASVDLYYAYSTDGAQTFSTPERLTGALSPNIGHGFEFGDYNGLDIIMNRLIAVFTDNRNEGGGGTDSVDVYAAGKTIVLTLFEDGFESGDTTAWSAEIQP